MEFLGTLRDFKFGKSVTGFSPGAYVSEMLYFPDKNSETCSKPGMSYMKSVFAEISFQSVENQRYVCFGSAKITFYRTKVNMNGNNISL